MRRARLRPRRLPLRSPAAVVLVLGDAPPSSLGLQATRFFLGAGGHLGFGADRICFLFFLFFGFLCLLRAPQGEIDPPILLLSLLTCCWGLVIVINPMFLVSLVYGFDVVNDVIHATLGGLFNQASVHYILFKVYISMLMLVRAI